MGCCNEKTIKKDTLSSFVICDEEEFLKDFEKRIPLASQSMEGLVDTLRQFQHLQVLNRLQLNYILKSLGFDSESISDPDSYVYRLIAGLKTESNLYSKEKVFGTSVILASGKSIEKASILFEIFDKSKNQTMERNDLRKMIQEIFKIAAIDLPSIALAECFENHNYEVNVNKEKIMKHLVFLRERQEFFVNRMINRVLEGEDLITQKRFVSKVVSDPVVESLVWSYMIRLALLE